MPGPSPMPTELKKITGMRKSRINDNEPKYTPIVGECPNKLPKKSKEEWNRLAPELEETGVITAADRDAFTSYCWLVGKCEELRITLDRGGLLHKTPNGHTQARPEVSMLREYMKLKNQLAIQFGLTPSSRSKIVASPKNQEDDFSSILD